jgi:hypothetical protein
MYKASNLIANGFLLGAVGFISLAGLVGVLVLLDLDYFLFAVSRFI